MDTKKELEQIMSPKLLRFLDQLTKEEKLAKGATVNCDTFLKETAQAVLDELPRIINLRVTLLVEQENEKKEKKKDKKKVKS